MTDDDEKAIFDKGRAGIGHNQGPALEPDEPETPPDIDNAPVAAPISGSALTDAAKVQLKEWEKSGQLEKVKQVSEFGSDTLESLEAGKAPGGNDGLVSRRGKRRVFRGDTEEETCFKEERVDLIQRTAARVLHGPDATMFELHYLNPLLGLPKTEVKELAAQFGKPEKRIYKRLQKSAQRVKRAIAGEPAPPRLNRPIRYTEIREQLDSTGKYYIDLKIDSEGDGFVTGMNMPPAKPEPTDTRTWDEKYGPKCKPKLSDFFSNPKRKAK